MRKQIADGDTALTVLAKSEGRRKSDPCFSFGLQVIEGKHLAAPLGKFRFRIERIDLRDASIEEDVNDMLGLAGKCVGMAARLSWTSKSAMANAPKPMPHFRKNSRLAFKCFMIGSIYKDEFVGRQQDMG